MSRTSRRLDRAAGLLASRAAQPRPDAPLQELAEAAAAAELDYTRKLAAAAAENQQLRAQLQQLQHQQQPRPLRAERAAGANGVAAVMALSTHAPADMGLLRCARAPRLGPVRGGIALESRMPCCIAMRRASRAMPTLGSTHAGPPVCESGRRVVPRVHRCPHRPFQPAKPPTHPTGSRRTSSGRR